MTETQPLSIGQFGRRTGLTAKALRHYDRIGLLHPASVDAQNGYRSYDAAQIQVAMTIARLRSLDVPLDAVRDWLAGRLELNDLLMRQRTRLESRVAALRGRLHEIEHFLTEGMETTMTTESATSGLDDRQLGIDLFNETWTLMTKEDRTRADDDAMIHMAHASRHHWGKVGTPAHLARGEWQISRVYAVLRRPEPCLHHAQRVLDLCQENDIVDWDLAFAFEAIARAHAIAGDAEQAKLFTESALAVEIAEDEDRELLWGDLESIPGQPRFW